MTPKPQQTESNVEPGYDYLYSSESSEKTNLQKDEKRAASETEDSEDIQEQRKKFMAFMRQDTPLLGLPQLTISRIFFWTNHVLAIYGLYLLVMGRFSWGILLFEFLYSYVGSLGTTIGAHRYWTHKSFKAKQPLRVLLMCAQTITAQYSIYKWSLDHRIHHKYTDTDKDPHNSKRGFWFSHMFWVLKPKHPEHEEKLRTFDMPDLEKDPLVLFQARWYPWLVYLFYCCLPVTILSHVWGIPRGQAHCLNCLRWVYNTHVSSAVNSFAHIFGDKPYDKDLTSADNKFVALFSVGEGWHNYHHTFPWDYKASELGWKINVSTMVIDFFAWIGWAYDLKTVSHTMLKQKIARSGDGSHPKYGGSGSDSQELEEEQNASSLVGASAVDSVDSTATWGWDDENVSLEFRKMTKILKPMPSEVDHVKCA